MWIPRLPLLTLVTALAAVGQPGSPAPVVPEIELPLTAATRLLVIAPHPDDEALGAAGLIQRVLSNAGSVRVLLMTSGDAFPEAVEASEGITHPKASDFRNFGLLREAETRSAMERLGLPRGNVTFLGFPDEGLCRLASTYLFDKRRAFESPYTDRVRPPPTEQVIRGVKYRGVDVRREIERVLTTYEPTLLAIPHPEDEHPDHCATSIFVREALAAVPPAEVRRVRVLHYLVHYRQWPLSGDAGVGARLSPPVPFPDEGRWVSLGLTRRESDVKKEAILDYVSQWRVIGRFMLAFGRDNELFLQGEPRSAAECWCDGDTVATDVPPGKYRRRP